MECGSTEAKRSMQQLFCIRDWSISMVGGGSLNFEPSERGGSLNFELTKRGWVIIFMIQFNKFYKNQTGEQHCANCSCITSLFLLRVSCD